ncbi:DUF4062 domain-containing protein [Sporolactobacillus putidus]|uniref:DUF4062 domain-containing protein n=1 Tax=Sporolactobacillus putidus TaxID=492735 RepID=A0A917W2W4_9BACL|nr:DUF4062 domain-containing protein [Sporolactobacillus putidus]GGL57072.1 hypothetical protein GCM10007968_21340 [Sporolactobacillus putidus]
MSGEYSINQTKIFISSPAQDSLKVVRQTIKEMIIQIGHIPIMFETNFGVAGNDSIRKCLDMVHQSDIYLLFIHNNGGSFVQEYGCTVTHLEFSKALIERKEIFVFVEQEVKEIFFKYFWHPLHEIFNKLAGPSDILNEVSKLKRQKPFSEISTDINVIVLLYDICQNGLWMNGFDINGGYTEIIKQHLSEVLQKGLSYLKIENEILSNSIDSKIFNDYKGLVLDTLSSFEIKKCTNWHRFLAAVMENMKGKSVLVGRETYLPKMIGKYGDCNGCTLYKRNGDALELVKPAIGVASDEHPLLQLNEDEYYVVLTYNKKISDPNVFVNRAKKRLYIALKVNQFVLCMHFPIEQLWPDVCNKAARDDIMASKQFVMLMGFIKSILGGIKDG